MITLNDINAVLVAKSLNLAIFQQVWLIENGIVNKDEFSGDAFFSPVAISVPTGVFDLLIVPERIQLGVKAQFEKSGEFFERIIGRIVSALPHTPYVGLGLNLNYFIVMDDPQKLNQACKRLLVGEKNPLGDEFSVDDARFGFYASKNIYDGRLKLDIKPVTKESRSQLLLNFNFHHDVAKPENIIDALKTWPKKFEYAQNISSLFEKSMESA